MGEKQGKYMMSSLPYLGCSSPAFWLWYHPVTFGSENLQAQVLHPMCFGPELGVLWTQWEGLDCRAELCVLYAKCCSYYLTNTAVPRLSYRQDYSDRAWFSTLSSNLKLWPPQHYHSHPHPCLSLYKKEKKYITLYANYCLIHIICPIFQPCTGWG